MSKQTNTTQETLFTTLEVNTYCWNCKKPTNTIERRDVNKSTACNECGFPKRLHIDTRGRIKLWQFVVVVLLVFLIVTVIVLAISYLVNWIVF